jgi:chemotaxis protein MotB
VAENDSEAGRGRNRRVTVLIESRTADLEPEPVLTTIPADDPIRSILPADIEG